MFGPAARSPRIRSLFVACLGMILTVIGQAPLIKLTLAALSPPNTILPSAHVAKVVCLVARRWALPAPLATTQTRLSIYARNGLADPPATARPPRIGRSTHAARLSHATLWRKTHRQHGDTNTHSNVSTPTQHSLTLTPMITRSQTAPAERGSAPATPWLPSSAASLRAPPSKMLRRRQRVRCLCQVRPGASSPHQAPG